MDLEHGSNIPWLILSALMLGALGILVYWLMIIEQVRLQDILSK